MKPLKQLVSLKILLCENPPFPPTGYITLRVSKVNPVLN